MRLTEAERDAIPAYIARCPQCGQMMFAAADDGHDRKSLAKDVADQIAAGYPVERTTVGWVREHIHDDWCTCAADAQAVQPSLLAVTP
jgi:hypothetical protein